MDRLSDLIQAVRPRRDGDVVDRLNYAYTTMMLAGFSGAMIGWSFVGAPIKCWYPAYFKGYWIEYGNEYCFIQNTYFYKMTTEIPSMPSHLEHYQNYIPRNVTERMEKTLPYYQWAPFVLAFQGLMFFAPMIMWRSMNGASGMCVDTILTEAAKTGPKSASFYEKISRYLAYAHDVNEKVGFGNFRRSYVTYLYLLVKFLFAFNAVMQFLLMNQFLGMGDAWGLKVFMNMLAGRTWEESGRFPRVTLCDFRVKVIGNVQRHTVQCVLLINMFYEKFYVGFWFWLLCLATINIISLLQWIVVAFSYKSRGFVTEYIDWANTKRSADQVDQTYGPVIDRFIGYLGQDGVMLLRMINSNAGGLPTGRLMEKLWDGFISRSASLTASPVDTQMDSVQSSPVRDEGIELRGSNGQMSSHSSKQSTV